jgi:hypothetical protein
MTDIPESYDCGYWQYSCKPADHKDHDVLCSDKYDAHYCYTCDAWIEPKCEAKKCDFCKNRPERIEKNEGQLAKEQPQSGPT